MRNTLILLSSLALAAAANAQSFASAVSTTSATYTVSGPLTTTLLSEYDGKSAGQYSTLVNEANPGDATTLMPTGSAYGFQNGNEFVTSSTTSASLIAKNPDYSGITGFVDLDTVFGYRDFLQVANVGTTAQTLTFHIASTVGGHYGATSPAGRATLDPNSGTFTSPGAFAYSGQGGGVRDLTDGNDEGRIFDSGYTTPSLASNDYSITNSFTLEFSIAAGQTVTYQIYSAAESEASYQPAPVPEPASLAALGVGALGLLRRRARR